MKQFKNCNTNEKEPNIEDLTEILEVRDTEENNKKENNMDTT